MSLFCADLLRRFLWQGLAGTSYGSCGHGEWGEAWSSNILQLCPVQA